MGLLNTLYNIVELDSSKYVFNTPVTSENVSAVQKLFTINATNIDLRSINTVFWNYGDPFSITDNEAVTYNLNQQGSHSYSRNGMYDVNCIINADNYTIHLSTKANILVNQDPLETVVDNYLVTLRCYDPQAIIYYSLLTQEGENWQMYTEPFTITESTPYYIFKAVLSNGESTPTFLNLLQPLTINFLEVFDPVYDGDIISRYTMDGTTSFATSAIEITAAPVSAITVSAARSIKVQFLIGDVDVSKSSIFSVNYYRDSFNGNVTNDIGNYVYSNFINIASTDKLYWRLNSSITILNLDSTINSSDFTIQRGIGSDIESLSLWVGNSKP